MGQSPSTTTSRHDNASTRTLHSASINSTRPLSFFRRISNRLSTHPTRRFGQQNRTDTTRLNVSSSTTSSVRRATQEAARAAAAVTGPPTSFLMQTPTHLQHHGGSGNSSSRNSVISSDSNNTSFWSELLASPILRETENTAHPFLRYLQVPLRVQQEINATMDEITSHTNDTDTAIGTTNTMTSTASPPQSSASSTTTNTRRMHILVIEYRTTNDNVTTNTPTTTTSSPSFRLLGLRRPRSQASSNSSTDTIQSMPLSMHQSPTHTNHGQENINNSSQWVVYLLNNQLGLSSSVLQDNPTYEDLLWLSNMLGPVRPITTTQAAIDETIPVIDWSDQLKDDSCLVCLDDFKLKQPVRVLKCNHVFHRECVDRWLCESHNSCPVCRGVPVETQ